MIWNVFAVEVRTYAWTRNLHLFKGGIYIVNTNHHAREESFDQTDYSYLSLLIWFYKWDEQWLQLPIL